MYLVGFGALRYIACIMVYFGTNRVFSWNSVYLVYLVQVVRVCVLWCNWCNFCILVYLLGFGAPGVIVCN